MKLYKVQNNKNDGGKVEIHVFGSKKAVDNGKAPALWTNNREGVDENE
jgi:hypothetical protein